MGRSVGHRTPPPAFIRQFLEGNFSEAHAQQRRFSDEASLCALYCALKGPREDGARSSE
jgi:hypothetical protein